MIVLNPLMYHLQLLSFKKRIAIAIASAFAAYLASRYILKKGREKSSKS
jgi:hypothetical protein